ncbi:hypothetical protein GPECTOR_17g987 [Gonium pectorale]|uniref:Uncharacterized protein n=1 Tax=Gonium pectorale TaxID=33097 RepID=A0A150GKH0_GONPE|nr:hypothetical protein GPECTOR_17g987 [Gonium pectorale]|eukprot:KXZ50346.1 hypothetical protein GPECTOR_17g987 [Gonium pectorale]
MQLADVEGPDDATPGHVTQIAGLLQEVTKLKRQCGQFEMRLFVSEKLRHQLALLQLLDEARERLAGHKLDASERGIAWNNRLQAMTDFKGMTKEEALLTKFGRNTQQQDSSRTAHNLDLLTITEAVTSATKKRETYCRLFKSVFEKDAQEMVFNAFRVVSFLPSHRSKY